MTQAFTIECCTKQQILPNFCRISPNSNRVSLNFY